MDNRLDQIGTLLLDGALFPGDWYNGLDRLRGALDAEVFHFFTLDKTEACVLDSVDNQGGVGLKAEKLRDYEEHYVSSDLRMSILNAMPVGEVMLDHEHISEREMSRNVVYNDFLGAHGFWNTLGTSLRDDGASRDVLRFLRASGRGAYGDQDRAFVERLLPTMSRAANLRARTAQLARQAALGMAALDSLPQGVAVVDARCRSQYINPAARSLMEHRLLILKNGFIECADAGKGASLNRLVKAACLRKGLEGAGSVLLQDAIGRLVVTVLPLKAEHPLALRNEPLALVILADPDRPTHMPTDLVAQMLGLSPTETRLALQLASGKTIKEFASTEGCSWHTARTHLKNLMRKTGCHRQADIVALLHGLRLG